MNKLVLDYSTWRCGADSPDKLGEGTTLLKNNLGFTCCLGQFSLQLDKGVTEEMILNKTNPNSTGILIPLLVEYKVLTERYRNTQIAEEAVRINDYPITTPDEKIKLLQELFKTVDYEIEVINKPI